MATTTGPNSGQSPGDDAAPKVRIGDAERERTMNALQEHLSAGRLTIDEYEQRTERAVAARYADELDELLVDLPPTEAEQERQRQATPPWQTLGTPRWRGLRGVPPPVLIALAVIVLLALPGPPWPLFFLFWLIPLLTFGRGRFGCGARRGSDEEQIRV